MRNLYTFEQINVPFRDILVKEYTNCMSILSERVCKNCFSLPINSFILEQTNIYLSDELVKECTIATYHTLYINYMYKILVENEGLVCVCVCVCVCN